jgi:uncharacterized protein (TIGR02145 family)
MSVPYALYASYASKTDTSVLNLAARFSPLNNKLNIVDTSTMLLNYRTGLNNKLNILDTVSMLQAYLRHVDTTGMLLPYLRDADTTIMLANYLTGINAKVNNADTSDMLNPYLRKADAVVSVETDPVFNVSVAKGITGIDTAYWNRKTGNITGNIQYWNGTSWVNLAPGQNGQALILVNGIPSWSTLSTTVTVTDIDGNTYNTVQIGNQVWMSENLKTTRYRNGGLIPNVTTDNTAWGILTTGAWSYYNNDVSNNAIYGKLYNWYTTLGDTLCPTGWGVPTDAEWTTLTTLLGRDSEAGGKMKMKSDGSTVYWNGSDTGATNESGFSALPGGSRFDDGSFTNVRNYASFWSASENGNLAWYRFLTNYDVNVYKNDDVKSGGFSVRCLRD